MNTLIVVFNIVKNDWNFIKWFLLAGVISTVFIVCVGVGLGMMSLRVVAVGLLAAIAGQLRELSRIAWTPFGRMCAGLCLNLLVWVMIAVTTSVVTELLAFMGVREPIVGTVPVVVAILLATWLAGKLYKKGWMSDLKSNLHIFLAGVKMDVVGESRHQDDFDALPILLTAGQRKDARFAVFGWSGLLLFAFMTSFVALVRAVHDVDSFNGAVLASVLSIATVMFGVWILCVGAMLWSIAYRPGGTDRIDPWEQCLVPRRH